MGAKRREYTARIYLGGGQYQWVGRFPTRRERDRAKARALAELERRRSVELTCSEYADRFLARYEREQKASSFDTASSSLKPFLTTFGDRRLDLVSRLEAKDWAMSAMPSRVPIVVTLFNAAIDDELIERNPFRGLGKRTKGRSAERPPTEDELTGLVKACRVHGPYAPMMRAIVIFAAYSGIRPGELYVLEWDDLDFERMRIAIKRRLYRGDVALPKSNVVREIALTPPARDAVLGLPRTGRLVFTAKRGGRLSQPALSGYWNQVLAAAGLDFDFYLATKHYCAHYLWVKLGLPDRVVKEQLGHIDEKLLRTVYGHGDVGALEEIDAAFGRNITPLRAIQDASETHGA